MNKKLQFILKQTCHFNVVLANPPILRGHTLIQPLVTCKLFEDLPDD